ncbi:hypothetical protein EDD15DRAFT_2275181, partial [Pisolithus albus]
MTPTPVSTKAGSQQAFILLLSRGKYLWAWSNTCCIHKESSIGSMFIWYRKSNLTIAYLAHISENDTLVGNR